MREETPLGLSETDGVVSNRQSIGLTKLLTMTAALMAMGDNAGIVEYDSSFKRERARGRAYSPRGISHGYGTPYLTSTDEWYLGRAAAKRVRKGLKRIAEELAREYRKWFNGWSKGIA